MRAVIWPFLSSVLSWIAFLFAAAAGRRRHPALAGYAVVMTLVDMVAWVVLMTHHQTLHLVVVHYLLAHLWALAVLRGIYRDLPWRWGLDASVGVLFVGYTALSLALRSVVLLGTSLGLVVFVLSLGLLLALALRRPPGGSLLDTSTFWTLSGFLILFSSQVAVLNWIHLTVERGLMGLLALYNVLSVVPVPLGAFCLAMASVRHEK